jgi:hypothetical protein
LGQRDCRTRPRVSHAVERCSWDQQKPPPGQDYTGCLNTSTSTCIEWAKTAQNLSINVDVYLASSLSAGSDLNLKTDVRNTLPKWDEVAARNPHLQETTLNDQ